MNYYPRQKHLKLVLNVVFVQPQMMTYVITIPNVLCQVVLWLMTSLWIYSQIPQNNNICRQKLFKKNYTIYFYQGSLRGYSWKKTMNDAKKWSINIITLKNILKYLCGLLYILFNEAYLKNKKIIGYIIFKTLISNIWFRDAM